MTMSSVQAGEGTITEYVTAMIGGQLFGMPISRVQDVFIPELMTRVPLASSDVAGVLNLRGRIVTAIDIAFPARPAQARYRTYADGGRGRPARRILWPVDRRRCEVLKLAERQSRSESGQPRSQDGEDGLRDSPARRTADGVLDVDRVLEIVPDMLAGVRPARAAMQTYGNAGS